MSSATGLPTGDELTLARERQAKQKLRIFMVSGNRAWPGSEYWHSSRLAYDDLICDHRNDERRTDDDRIGELFDGRRSRRSRSPLRP